MSHLAIRSFVLTVVISSVLTVSTAEAAKGIKKGNQTNGTHTVHGIVTSITPDKSGYGVFQIRSSYNHRKSSGTNPASTSNGSGSNHPHRTFNVSSSTAFRHHASGPYGGTNSVGPTALQRGQHVTVRYTGQHADQIQINTSTSMMRIPGRFYHNYYSRHRPVVYNPYAYHHLRHRGAGF